MKIRRLRAGLAHLVYPEGTKAMEYGAEALGVATAHLTFHRNLQKASLKWMFERDFTLDEYETMCKDATTQTMMEWTATVLSSGLLDEVDIVSMFEAEGVAPTE